MRLTIYRSLSFLLVIEIALIVWFLTVAKTVGTTVAILLLLATLAVQVVIVKCPHCGTRPGLWLLAIWTALLDFELYFADTVLLRECPKCRSSLRDARS